MNSLGDPGKGEAFVGERRSSVMRELSPTAEARDMKLAPTIWRVRNCPAWLACWTLKKRETVASSADGPERGRGEPPQGADTSPSRREAVRREQVERDNESVIEIERGCIK